ncbi:Hypothetical predicted protein [Mytilus galloprovincialis]|uniref:Uncharacterized protein n=1 Tax=Mytilus galloprovincialis TaxID=29158 RepID=A0A8B6HI50_MYTGA|nr:Hypothetical predicted protein [Mytilus galloprovincialis]
MQNLNLGVIPSYAFTDFTCRRAYLQSSSITDIKKHAFYNFRANDYFYLNSNQLTTISSSIFGGTSYVEYLQMFSNGLTSITSDGFRNVDVDYIYLQNNGLTVYPIALNEITPIQIHLYSNEISIIPKGSFDSQTRLQRLYMYNNNITQISAGLLTPAISLRNIDFHDNQIQYIEEGSFNGLSSLQTLDLGQNVIPYFPSVILPAITTLDLADNRIEALGGLNLGGSTSVNLDNNFLGCECSTVESLYNVKDGLSANTMCYSPTALQGVLFASSQSSSPDHFTKKEVALFQCSGENIVGTAVSSTNITITWDRPSYIYSLVNASNDETETAEKVTNSIETWEYLVTCTSNTAATLTTLQTVVLDFPECIINTPCNTTADNTTVTSSNSTTTNTTVTDCSTIDSNCTKSTDHTTSVSFGDVDGLLPLTLYECVIELTVDNYTSAKSVPTFIFTPAVITGSGNETTENNVTTNSKDINMDMTFYDFSAGHDDFSSTSGILSVSPFHVTSPLGSWLAISSDPTTDTFSEWFRSASSNVVVQGGITLSYDNSTTTSVVRRYNSGSFFPVDNSGYGAEGQTDCGGTLHNFAFTSAIRSGLTFSGSEVITLGGGEELWLYINKKLVVEIVQNRTTSDIPCQKIDLSTANGGGYVIPEEGILVNGDCVGLSPLTSASVYVELEVGETYPFEIFHAERHPCTSELFIQFENVDLPENGSLPFNYHLTPREDLHVNGIVGVFNVWDIFATGPSFQVELLSGNEARHFTLKEDTIANRNAATTVTPPTYEYVFVKGTNMSYVECAPEVMIPEPSTPGSEIFTISTSQVLLTLVTELDYEVEQTYTITLRVADTGSGLTGSLVIRVIVQDVNDNCPSLTSILYITPRPILQLDPLFKVQSQDSDSGINAEIQVYISPIIYESPPVDYTYISDIRRQVYNGSTELTLEIIGMDHGTPPRGSAVNITVNISNTCLIDELLDRTNVLFTVNQSSGDVYLRIPGYWVINYTCTDYIGIYNGLIRDDQMTASSSRSKLTLPDRARLENNASDPVFGPLAGGWVAGTNDLDQYIEVNMEEFYQIKQIHLQGQQDEANWVTAFRVYYVDNTTGNWTLYKNDVGEFVSELVLINSIRKKTIWSLLIDNIIWILSILHP